jgi:3-hydroxypropanoate dehydrogenase
MTEGKRVKTVSAPAVAVLAVDTGFYDQIPELLPSGPRCATTSLPTRRTASV